MAKRSSKRIAKRVSFNYLVSEVAHRAGIPKYKADEIIRITFAAIKEILYNKCIVDIPLFGSFYLLIARQSVFNLPSGEKIWKDKRLLGKFRFAGKFRAELEKVKLDNTEENDIDDITL